MVSRRNFFTITVIMLVVLAMFQIPEVAKDRMNHYDENKYEEQTKTGFDETSVYIASEEDVGQTGRFVVYIGDIEDDSVGSVVSQWCLYTKRYLEAYPSVSEYQPDKTELPEAVLIDTRYLEVGEEMGTLSDFTEMGINLIFCNLPDVSIVDGYKDFKEMLGIRYLMSKNITAEGIRLLNGFLLGGQREYKLEPGEEESRQDFDLEMPWYLVSSGTKTYMAARVKEENNNLKNENLPAIIWRNSAGNAQVFVVNGDYLGGNTGIGILSGMMSEMYSYDIYPVINAQNLVITNYPDLASENEEEMMKRYSQSLKAVCRDIIWPGITSVAQRNSLKMTCMLTPQMDYADETEPEGELLIYYMKLMQEQSAEAGVSGSYRESTEFSEKVRLDSAFLSSVIPDYTILSFYQGNMTDEELGKTLEQDIFQSVRTVYKDFEDQGMLIEYLDSDMTGQCSVSNGYNHTFREDFRLNSIETALGYSSIVVDANAVAYPKSDEDSWEKMSEQLAGNIDTYWKAYKKFGRTTLAESDARIRRFLALNYTQNREEDSICLDISNFDGEAWFILRTHGEEIAEAQGADFEKIEEGAYLIGAYDSKVVLRLEESDQCYYYYESSK